MEKLGHKVLTPYNAFEADAESAPKGSQVYRRDMAWIEQCELFIDEDFRIFVRDRIQTGYLLGATDKTITLLYRRALEVKYHC